MGGNRIVITAAALIIFSAAFFYGCSKQGELSAASSEGSVSQAADTAKFTLSENTASDPAEKETISQDGAEVKIDPSLAAKVLENFLSSRTKYIKGQYSSIYYDGSKDGPTGFELWSDGSRMRIDYYKADKLYRTLILKDGNAIFYVYASKKSTPSITPTDYYLNLFNQNILDIQKNGGVVSDNGIVFLFDIDAFYINSKATQGYFITQIDYCADNTKILYQTVYGRDSSGGKPSHVNTVVQTMDTVESDISIDEKIFDSPF